MCCGGKRTTMRPSSAYRPSADAGPAPIGTERSDAGTSYFQQVGSGALVVQGPVSGKRYRFAAGATVAVDSRDRASLMRIPYIREIRR